MKKRIRDSSIKKPRLLLPRKGAIAHEKTKGSMFEDEKNW